MFPLHSEWPKHDSSQRLYGFLPVLHSSETSVDLLCNSPKAKLGKMDGSEVTLGGAVLASAPLGLVSLLFTFQHPLLDLVSPKGAAISSFSFHTKPTGQEGDSFKCPEHRRDVVEGGSSHNRMGKSSRSIFI